jgi:hypothetical protein
MKVGVFGFVFACACSHETTTALPADSPPPDPCAKAALVDPPTSACVPNGLANQLVDGMATLTGTQASGGWDGDAPNCYVTGTQPITQTLWVARSGTGWCKFGIDSVQIMTPPMNPDTFVDDTFASFSESGDYPHQHAAAWSLCVSPTDGKLHYHSFGADFMPNYCSEVDGVLTQ